MKTDLSNQLSELLGAGSIWLCHRECPTETIAVKSKPQRFVRSQEIARRQVDIGMDSPTKLSAVGIGSPEWIIKPAKDRGMTLVS